MKDNKFSWESGYFASLMTKEFSKWEDQDADFSITPQFEAIDTLFTLYNEAEEAGLLNTKEYNPENAWDIGYDVFFAECIKDKFNPNIHNYGIDITKWKHHKNPNDLLAHTILDNLEDYESDVVCMMVKYFEQNPTAKDEWASWMKGK